MAFSDSHGRSGKAEETIEYFSSAGVADLSRSDTVVLHNAIDFPDRALLLAGRQFWRLTLQSHYTH